MSEALWAQVIAGAFGLASLVLGTYLPARIRRREDLARDTGTRKGYYRPRRSSDLEAGHADHERDRRHGDQQGDGNDATSDSGIGT
jgi:hypothetical protein